MTKTVALLGFAPSRHEAENLSPDIEVWSCNHAWQYFDRLDAVIEIHLLEYIQQEAYYANHEIAIPHMAWLHSPHDFSIYMVDEYPDCPAAVRYPIEGVLAMAPRRYFSSSFAYMIALAIYQGFERIEIYGFDMASNTEWFYQRPNSEWWIGYAEGRGIDVYIGKFSPLCKAKALYGYEGGSMVDRQVLEQVRDKYKAQFVTATEQYNKWQGIFSERQRHGATKALKQEAAEQIRGYENTAMMCDGAVQAVQSLIDECDLVPVDIPVFLLDGIER